MGAHDLLFEIGTEEIPARFAILALDDLKRIAEEELTVFRLRYEHVRTYVTPRRLVLFVNGLEDVQQELLEKVRGPQWGQAFDANGNPTNAAMGFARSRGVSTEDLEIVSVDGVDYACSVVRQAGCPTEEILPELLQKISRRLSFPKSMYWSDPNIRFARPVRWLVALWGDRLVDVSFGDVASGRISRGHRFLGGQQIEIGHAKDYLGRLYEEFVLVDQGKRKEKMLSSVAAIEKEIGAKAELDPDLVDENVHLVEYPVAFYGMFDKDFLDIPEEVLTTTMKKNQRYFPVRDSKGRLMAYFIGVSNNAATDMSVVREGNERVLRARLYDAAFFWKEDQQKPLAERTEELKGILFQERLGSMYEKMLRIRNVAAYLVDELKLNDLKETVDRAAFLSKSDLVTNMVYEFPELQGVMGREYALRNGEPPAVAKAIYEQYLPRSAGDKLPSELAGAILGLAERADTLVAIHQIGMPPTGSQDPYGLRRAARCINEILWGLKLDVNLRSLLERAAKELNASDSVVDKVWAFVIQRLQTQVREKGYAHTMTALAVGSQEKRPLQVMQLLEALDASSKEEWFADLQASAIRVHNILSKSDAQPTKIDESLFQTQAERDLYATLQDLFPKAKAAFGKNNWSEVGKILHALSTVIGEFFDTTLVMDKDDAVRNNRLALLGRCQELFSGIGDFTLLKG